MDGGPQPFAPLCPLAISLSVTNMSQGPRLGTLAALYPAMLPLVIRDLVLHRGLHTLGTEPWVSKGHAAWGSWLPSAPFLWDQASQGGSPGPLEHPHI